MKELLKVPVYKKNPAQRAGTGVFMQRRAWLNGSALRLSVFFFVQTSKILVSPAVLAIHLVNTDANQIPTERVMMNLERGDAFALSLRWLPLSRCVGVVVVVSWLVFWVREESSTVFYVF